MNAEKLKKLQASVRIGGKGTPRRKKKIVHQTAATDDKKLQSSLKKLSVNTIPGIEEVNMIRDDGTVIHFNNPKAQASLAANTFAITGHGEHKQISEMLPGILTQLGPEGLNHLKRLANNVVAGNKLLSSVAEEDDVPTLVENFDEVSQKDVDETASKKAATATVVAAAVASEEKSADEKPAVVVASAAAAVAVTETKAPSAEVPTAEAAPATAAPVEVKAPAPAPEQPKSNAPEAAVVAEKKPEQPKAKPATAEPAKKDAPAKKSNEKQKPAAAAAAPAADAAKKPADSTPKKAQGNAPNSNAKKGGDAQKNKKK